MGHLQGETGLYRSVTYQPAVTSIQPVVQRHADVTETSTHMNFSCAALCGIRIVWLVFYHVCVKQHRAYLYMISQSNLFIF